VSPEAFQRFIMSVIAEEVYAGDTCACGCGDTPVHGIADAATRITAAVAERVASAIPCERCSKPVTAVAIKTVGPYQVCPDCEPIVAGRY